MGVEVSIIPQGMCLKNSCSAYSDTVVLLPGVELDIDKLSLAG